MALSRPADRPVRVDAGVLRWADDGREVALFGVNYYTPFALDYRALGQVGADRDLAIKRDVAQFVRLGLDVIRLHCFDREISDPGGNLVDNDHLRLLDLLLAECKRNGIYAVLTPIAWWGTGGPTDGFSDRYSMARMITDPEARAAQQRYLGQFLRHRNRYTGLPYAEDPCIVALELINEPIPPADTPDTRITEYIDALVASVRGAGCGKPVFFNGWGGRLGAVGRSKADGCTFGWYPTGLVSGHELTGDYLPRVADFPDMRSPQLAGKAIGVYEFDAADTAKPVMYPAMARAFRAGGAQFAAQFQYDVTPLATTNCNWQTHFLNLVYTPRKAISFMIAAEAFRSLPRRHALRSHPANTRFGEFRISFAQELSERVGPAAFLYSGSTHSRPPSPARLLRVAGCGSSPVVEYGGTGAYFLDRIGPGLWRLEVYPDIAWVADPFGPTSLSRETARVYWNRQPMAVRLPDLGARFQVRSADGRITAAYSGRFTARPGVYHLRRQGIAAKWPTATPAFWARPQDPSLPLSVRYDPPKRRPQGMALPVACEVAPSPGSRVRSVQLEYRPAGTSWRSLAMAPRGPFGYAGTVPAAAAVPGDMQVRLAVDCGKGIVHFPGAYSGDSRPMEPIDLLRFAPNGSLPPLHSSLPPGQVADAKLAQDSGATTLRLACTGFGPPPSCAAIDLPATGRPHSPLPPTAAIRLRARARLPQTSSVELALVDSTGQGYGADAPISSQWSDILIPLREMRPLWGAQPGSPDLARLDHIRLTFGSWLYGGGTDLPHELEVASVALVAYQPAWQVSILPAAGAVPLLLGDQAVTMQGSAAATARTVGSPFGPALRVEVAGFGPPPDNASFRVDLAEQLLPWRSMLRGRPGLRIRVRATEPGTTRVEVVVLEEDGAPWGIDLPITTDWKELRIPWRDLRFFSHWEHPGNRGAKGDQPHPERISAINLCFGAWQMAKESGGRHGFEVQSISVEPAR